MVLTRFSLRSLTASRSLFYGVAIALIWLPSLFAIRFLNLNGGFYETHYIRQNQTALTVRYLSRGETGFLNYQSPHNGKLWNFNREMPLYQWAASRFLRAGLTLEKASRVTTLIFHFAALPFLFLLFSSFAGRQVAWWGALFYLGLPFTTIYSRVCLIDMTALSFSIAGTYFALCFWKKENIKDWIWATILLSLSGLIKITIWFGPAASVGVFLCGEYFKSPRTKRVYLSFLSMAIQSIFCASWMFWANKTFGAATQGSDTGWIIGTLSQRIDVENYKILLKTFMVQVLNYWAVVPFSLGIVLWPYGRYRAVLAGLALVLPVMVFFNVTIYHDYYFLNSVLPTLFFASVGLQELFKLKILQQRVAVVCLGLGIFAGVRSLPAFYNTLLSLRTYEKSKGEVLNRLTDPSDIIFSDVFFPRMAMAVQADRFLLLNPSVRLESLEPTFFYFGKEMSIPWLANLKYPRLTIQSNIGHSYGYRLHVRGDTLFDRNRHLAVENGSDLHYDLQFGKKGNVDINLCRAKRGFVVAELKVDPREVLEVSFKKTKTTFLLPVAESVSLPAHSSWGCEVSLSHRYPEEQDPSYRMVFPPSDRLTKN